MIYLLTRVSFLTFFACAFVSDSTNVLTFLRKENYYIVTNCNILDIEGQLVRSYPGSQCVFLDDGSFLSYDGNKKELSKYNSLLEKVWTLKRHVHHEIKVTTQGDFLINSSEVRDYEGFKNVRFDQVLLVDSNGKIKKSFSFYIHASTIPNPYLLKPYVTKWEENLEYDFEFTHVSASYEITEVMKKGDEVFAPKGSFLISLNSTGRGVYVLDKDLNRVVNFREIPSGKRFHDAQRFSHSEIILYENNSSFFPKDPIEESRVVVLDIFKNKESKILNNDFYAIYTGGIQVINEDLLIVSDLRSRYGTAKEGVRGLNLEQLLLEQEKRKVRLTFYSPKSGVLKEVHLNHSSQHAKLQKLKSFLKKNIGL